MAQVIDGDRRNGKILTYQGYRYQRNQTRAAYIYWRCSSQLCRSALKTDHFNVDNPPANINVIVAGAHTHPPVDEVIARRAVVNAIKHDIERNPTMPVKRTYDNTVSRLVQNVRNLNPEDIPEFHNIESQLRRARQQNIPPIPANIAAVAINGVWGETTRGDRYLLRIDNNWGILIFATDADLILLSRSRRIFLDGTFKTAPQPYRQFFTVHGMIQGRVLHLASGLLTQSNIGSYREVFRVLKQEVRRASGVRWRPASAVIDFEQAIITAFETEFRQATVMACYFHFTQSLWRYIQRLGLANAYRNNRHLKKCLRKVMALGFLPLLLLRVNYNNHRNSPRTRRLIGRFPALLNFFRYFENNYLNGNFPPQMWNVFTRPMEFRTNNSVESYHRRWNAAVGVRHPSLWVFIRILKDQHTIHETAVAGMRNGNPPPIRRRKWRILERRINHLKNEYNNGIRNIDDYWRAVCHVIMHFN